MRKDLRKLAEGISRLAKDLGLRASLVAAGRFGLIVRLDAFVLETPHAVIGLDVHGVGSFLGRKIVALLEQVHVVLEGSDHAIVGHFMMLGVMPRVE